MLGERYLRAVAFQIANLRDGNRRLLLHRREFLHTAFTEAGTLQEGTGECLRALLAHAYNTCPYYRRIMRASGLPPARFSGFNDLEKMPLLDKDTLEKKRMEMVSSSFALQELRISFTGGSNGTPTSFYRDPACHSARMGRQLGILELLDYRLGDRCGLIWGAHQDLPKGKRRLRERFRDFAHGRKTLDCTLMDEDSMSAYYQELIRYRPAVLYGYPSAIRQFGTYLLEKNLPFPRVRAVFCTAEQLNEAQREMISAVFGGEVYNLYCTREHGCVAFECRRHRGLHIDIGSVRVEIIGEGGRPVENGETGEMVITDLLNYGMPFIRYRIGDRGSLAPYACDCGSSLPLLERLEGRVADMLIRPDGRKVSGVMLVDVFKGNEDIQSFQVVQEKLDEIDLFLVVGERFARAGEERVVQALGSFLGPDVRIRLRVVPQIPRNPHSGKQQEVICRVPLETSSPA